MSVTTRAEPTVPLDKGELQSIVERLGFDVRRASIREMNNIVDAVQRETGLSFIRMEFGVPGLSCHPAAVEAETAALRDRDVGHVYAPFEGLPVLKAEAARFVKSFMDIDVPDSCCVPTVGAMEGCFAGLALAGRMRRGARTVLCLEPGFPVNKLQLRFLGLKYDGIDFYDHRGDDLVRAIEERARRGDLCAVIWSSPNNPSWIVLTEDELRGIGRVCDRYGLIAIEDLAYFGMDVRRDYLVPGEPPFQPTVLRYTKRGVCLISSSKIFSYAGQRVALAVISPELMAARAPDLEEYYGTEKIGHALVHGVLYPIAACVPESPQYGLTALLRLANEGDREVFRPAREYAERAAAMKAIFLGNGFRLVYDNDCGEPLADGFYFTVSYPGYDDGGELLAALLPYGISAITLETTGSVRREGLRACVSLVGPELFPELERRLARFHEDQAGR